MTGSRRHFKHLLYFSLFFYFASELPEARADRFLSNVREDVRSTEPATPPPPREEPSRKRRRRGDSSCGDDSDYFGLVMFVGLGVGYTVTSPFWGPPVLLGDSYDTTGYFPEFPYSGHREGNMVFSCMTCDCGALLNESGEAAEHAPYCSWNFGSSKTFSGHFTGEWAEQPGDVNRVGGRLQLNMSSRFGLDTQMDWLREPASGPQQDELWLGDCNLVFRFAQSERAQFYTGVGFNWLDDPVDTNYGFNFTYGADFFPARPWVISSSIDWGNLGRAEQFRFRTTAGLMINRFEVFAGYEYLDIDRTQMNMYLGGVGIWF